MKKLTIEQRKALATIADQVAKEKMAEAIEIRRRGWALVLRTIVEFTAMVMAAIAIIIATGCATRPAPVTQTQPADEPRGPVTQPESPWDFPRDPEAPREQPVVVDRPQWRSDALRTQQSAISALLHDRVPVPADLVAVRDTLDYGLGYLDEGATWFYVATMQRRGIAGLQTSGVASSYADEFREVLRALTMAAVREG